MPDGDYISLLASPVAAYEEGLRFLRGKGMANDVLRGLVADLEAHGIAYSVIGAVALNQHGYRRFTEDIDLLLTPEGLTAFQTELVGRGYRPAFAGATRKFRETGQSVPIEVILSGEYPGDGKPKSVRFHDPSEHSVVIDGVRTVTLEKLIELKLASGISGRARLKDLADAQELIRLKHLDSAFAERLDPFVRAKYLELWSDIEQAEEQF